MTKLGWISLIGAALAMATPVSAQSDFDFTGPDKELAGEPTRVLVLGSPHLTQLPAEAFPLEHLELILDRLEAFAPDVIAIEALSGLTCDQLLRHPQLFNLAGETYCYDPMPTLEAIGMSAPEAALAAEEALTTFPDKPTAADHTRLAALLLAAGERWSAALHWSYLEESERVASEMISEGMKAYLDRLLASRNESGSIGVALARRLGLTKVSPMDDHTADIITGRAPETLSAALREMWSTPNEAAQQARAKQAQFMGSPAKALASYRFLNSREYQQMTIDNDFGKAARTAENGGVTRQYLAWWQARGLRMAANVVEAAGNQPGAKVLVIVGASHKSYFDAYLDQMQDIEIVDVDAVLID
ncbi:MAG: DUF5694 domain-containing protein [Pseudomonadota bacterium]